MYWCFIPYLFQSYNQYFIVHRVTDIWKVIFLFIHYNPMWKFLYLLYNIPSLFNIYFIFVSQIWEVDPNLRFVNWCSIVPPGSQKIFSLSAPGEHQDTVREIIWIQKPSSSNSVFKLSKFCSAFLYLSAKLRNHHFQRNSILQLCYQQ